MPTDEDGFCCCCGHKGPDCDCSNARCNCSYFHCKKHCRLPVSVEEDEEDEEPEYPADSPYGDPVRFIRRIY